MSSPLIRIINSTFQRTTNGPHFFPNLNFTLQSINSKTPIIKPQRWSIIGPSNSGKSTFLQVLQGSHVSTPIAGRTYPALTEKKKYPGSAIALVDFSAQGAFGESVRGEYMSSRYESRRGATDLTLRQWLERTALHLPLYTDNFDFEAHVATKAADVPLEVVTEGLKLTNLLDQPVSTLSNGQGRRARIAQALLRGVDLLLLDEPFMGLDPWSIERLSGLIKRISSPEAASDSNKIASQVVVTQRPQDHLPEWVTHIAYLRDSKVLAMGEREEVVDKISERGIRIGDGGKEDDGILHKVYGTGKSIPGEAESGKASEEKQREPVVEMSGIKISYRDRDILKDFSWTIKRGDRWGLFGPNGSGKTTLLAIITSDHPLSYSQPVKLFGRSRLPEKGTPGISVFELQSLIGHSSPEIHQFFPRRLSLRKCVESSWSDTFITKPHFPPNGPKLVDDIFKFFEISPEEQKREFGECSVSTQRLALLMRAVVKKPDIVILDEAFSGMDEKLRDRCMEWLEGGLKDRQALIVVSHLDGEVPRVVDKWVRLREAGEGEGAVFGTRS
ncbi:hypothetical protein TWF481_011532 [Arthrobotrys musiformis]|uniref:ABC transporter domain-containing protein n=1 Tax=Arthrobotrys musiformis TaxID=47236 RepID=A0AAV9W008_9PEZI